MGLEAIPEKWKAHLDKYGWTPPCFTFALDVLLGGKLPDYVPFMETGPLPVEMEDILEKTAGVMGVDVGMYSGSGLRWAYPLAQIDEVRDEMVKQTTDRLINGNGIVLVSEATKERWVNHMVTYVPIKDNRVSKWDPKLLYGGVLEPTIEDDILYRQIEKALKDGRSIYTFGFSLDLPDRKQR